MLRKTNSFIGCRRQFFKNFIQVGSLVCIGCMNLLSFPDTVQEKKQVKQKHKFQGDAGMTFEEVFTFTYQGYVSLMKALARDIGKHKLLDMLIWLLFKVIIKDFAPNKVVTMVQMNVKTFEKLIKTENSARLYFRKKCYKKSRIFCTRCKSTKIYRIKGKKYRCKQCKYTFHDFTDRWINKLRCSLKTWLWLNKTF